MATGTIASVTSPTTGTVDLDEGAGIFPYDDPNLPGSGITLTPGVTRVNCDIDFTQRDPVATNITLLTETTTEITTPVAGDRTVNPGETLIIKSGGILTGNLKVTGGKGIVGNNGRLIGNTTVEAQGVLVVRAGGELTGAIDSVDSSVVKVINNGKVTGDITIAKGNKFILGVDGEPGGKVTGAISIQKIKKVIITANSKVNCP